LIPIHYIGWTMIILAILRFTNKAYLNIKWKLAFSSFTALYSLSKLSSHYASSELTNILYFLCAACLLIPFLKINFDVIKNLDKISDTSLLIGVGIIVLLS